MNTDALPNALTRATAALTQRQRTDGHWCFELEADCSISAEYILMMHYLGEIDEALQARIAVYLRRTQSDEGGWPLYYGATADISCTVKAYYALKLAGDNPNAPHMLKARRVVLERGGAARANVFTRIALAMFAQVPWRAVPFIPVEVMLFPKWFPFHLSKVSYWSRTVMVPLFVLCSHRATAKNPHRVDIRELFTTPPEVEQHYFPVKTKMGRAFLILDKLGRLVEPLLPGILRRYATRKAIEWTIPRLNGEDGLGGIFPAMVNAYEAMLLTGYDPKDPLMVTVRKSIDKLLVHREHESYCQPCLSPVWDTGLATLALQELPERPASAHCEHAIQWLLKRQITDGPADWRQYEPTLAPGGWAFQYRNDYYPDLDDTAVVAIALLQSGNAAYEPAALLAADWIVGMQSDNGGFAAFDANNTYYYLNHIPFADHGALLDPPTEDVTARCVMLMGRLVGKYPRFEQPLKRALNYLWSTQQPDGSWFGRWGTNYIYGTWSALMALESAGIAPTDERIRRATDWLKSVQNADGGWGEDNDSYAYAQTRGHGYRSAAYQTAWALIALMSAGQTRSDAVHRGVEFLLSKQGADGLWHDPDYTAPGFPRVFYLKYYGYDKFFPLWALARYHRETRA